MKIENVTGLLDLFESNGIEVVVDGGWAVDALIGQQTREHTDLDIALAHKDVPKLRELLEKRGYKDVPRDDTREHNFVLSDGKGNEVDVHSYVMDEQGNVVGGIKYPTLSLTGMGEINGRKVKCISLDSLIKFHTGYELHKSDFHDMNALHAKFGIELPPEYKT